MYLRILKYLSNKGLELDPSADNSDKFELTDNSDGKGAFISSWNVPGIAHPKLSALPSEKTAQAWGKLARNKDKVNRAEFLAATDVGALAALLEPCIDKINMFEGK